MQSYNEADHTGYYCGNNFFLHFKKIHDTINCGVLSHEISTSRLVNFSSCSSTFVTGYRDAGPYPIEMSGSSLTWCVYVLIV